MFVEADLHKLRHHQDFLKQEQRIAEELYALLDIKYQLARDLSPETANSLLQHRTFAQGLIERTRQRSELLQNTHERLFEAKHVMSQKVHEANI